MTTPKQGSSDTRLSCTGIPILSGAIFTIQLKSPPKPENQITEAPRATLQYRRIESRFLLCLRIIAPLFNLDRKVPDSSAGCICDVMRILRSNHTHEIHNVMCLVFL